MDTTMIKNILGAYGPSGRADRAAEAIKQEGIILNESIQSDMIIISYAAYLFRKRAGTDTAMPKFLRYQLNNLLFGQKAVVK